VTISGRVGSPGGTVLAPDCSMLLREALRVSGWHDRPAGEGSRNARGGGSPYKVEACDFEEHASTFRVVGPAFSGDKWDKWWITRGLTRPEAVDNLWTGKLIDSITCDTYKG